MKLVILIILMNALITESNKVSDLKIEIKLNKVNQTLNGEYYLDGVLIISNNSSKSIAFPKTFDLDIVLRDSSMNLIQKKQEVLFEYHNLISSQKAIRLNPNESIELCFIEWRLFLYELNKDSKYLVQYSLNTMFYKQLKRRLGNKVFFSNIVNYPNEGNHNK